MSAATDRFGFDLDSADWTPERLDAMLIESDRVDLDWRRFEIVDGVLVVSPPPMPPHEVVVISFGATLRAHTPEAFVVLAAARVRCGRSYRVTDIAVVSKAGYRDFENAFGGTEVLLAVEIESPSSVTTDRVTKAAQYASAGIIHYWRVEADPFRLLAHRLVDGVYAETGSWGADETARITDPFPVEFEITSLLPDWSGLPTGA